MVCQTERSSPLSDAAMGYRIRSSHYRRVADVSGVVASRDLRAIVNAGLLIARENAEEGFIQLQSI